MFICCYLNKNGEIDCIIYDNHDDAFKKYSEWKTATIFEIVESQFNGVGRRIMNQKVKGKVC